MAQIFGIFRAGVIADPTSALSRMGDLMRRPLQAPAMVWTAKEHGGGLGALTSQEFGGLYVGGAGPTKTVLALDGVLHEADRHSSETPERTATRLLGEYERHGVLPEGTRGSFGLAIYDPGRRRMLLVSDPCSSRCLYWTYRSGLFAFASEMKALLALDEIPVTLDPQAVATYLRYGRLFGSRTPWRDVQLLPPGTQVAFDLETGHVQLTRTNRLESQVLQRHPLTADRQEALAEAFRQGVGRSYPSQGNVGLSLSGGLDSRAIVAVLVADQQQARLQTAGLEGCMDERVGAMIARVAKLPWVFAPVREADVEDYLEALERYVYLTEGMMVPEGYPGIAPLNFSVEARLTTLLRGHGGENARLGDAWPFQVSDTVLRATSRDAVLAALEPNSPPGKEAWAGLFADAGFRQCLAQPEDTYASFARSLDPALSPAEVISLMYLFFNDATQVAVYRNTLRGYVEMDLPFLDPQFLELVLSTKVADRRGEDIHYHIIRRHCSALMAIPNSNHGAPLSASPLRRKITERLRGLLRRVQWPGFRHYHYADQWIRNRLRAKVQALLLEPRTLSRGIFDPPALRRLLEEPSVGNHGRLLARLVALEMWLRLFVDGEARNYSLRLGGATPTSSERRPHAPAAFSVR